MLNTRVFVSLCAVQSRGRGTYIQEARSVESKDESALDLGSDCLLRPFRVPSSQQIVKRRAANYRAELE